LNASLELIYELENQFRDIQLYQQGVLDKSKPLCAGLDMALFKELKKLKGINEQLR
jgi:hypothetical protein